MAGRALPTSAIGWSCIEGNWASAEFRASLQVMLYLTSLAVDADDCKSAQEAEPAVTGGWGRMAMGIKSECCMDAVQAKLRQVRYSVCNHIPEAGERH